MANPCLQPKLSDFCGYPFEVYTETKTEVFYRNNCNFGQDGSGVSYSKTYTSHVNDAHLQRIINEDISNFNAEGQINANNNGTCSTVCQPSIITRPRYSPIAITGTNFIIGDTVNLTRAEYLNNIISSGFVLSNRTDVDWHTPYPHNNYSNLVGISMRIVGSAQNIYGHKVSTSNACIVPSEVLLWSSPAVPNVRVSLVDKKSICFTNGVLLVFATNATDKPARTILLKWWDTDTNIITNITSFSNPNGESHYVFNSIDLVYNGIDSVYVMMSFRSPNNPKRTRTGFFRVVMSSGAPTGSVITIQNYDYSNQGLNSVSGVHAGSRLFFMYTEDDSWKFSVMEGTAPSGTNAFLNWSMNFMRDPTSPNIAYGGTLYRSGILSYNNTTNSWAVIKTD